MEQVNTGNQIQPIQPNQHEVKNSQENSFYYSIREKILNSDLDSTFDKIIKKRFEFKKDEFELIGNIAYMFGLEFCSQTKNYRKNIMNNFVLRMNDLKITKEQLSKFQNIIENISIENLEEIKDSVKDLITEKIKFESAQSFNTIRVNVNTIFKSSIFQMQFAVEINDLMKSKNYSYGELLKINKIIYENINMLGSSFNNLNKLYKNPEFVNHINKASNYFDLQKFSVVYFDSILTLKEYFENSHKDGGVNNYLELFENPELIEQLSEVLEVLETEKVVDEIEKEQVVDTELKLKYSNPEDVDYFIMGVLIEVNENNPINDENDMFMSLMKISENSDLVQYVYQFIKENKDKNRTEFENVFGFPRIIILDRINTYLDNVKEHYKKLVQIYVSEINPDIHQRVITYVNDLICSCIIDNAERKSYLFSQLNENGINTYKQLHQMIGLIEDCNITGENVHTYVNLRDYLANNVKIKDIFESIEQIEKLQFEMQFFTGVLEFYSIEYNHNLIEALGQLKKV